jgi:hypothetical protein
MKTLDKEGYRISLAHWIGNLGNHIIQLSGALNVAEKTHSRLTIPKHPLFKRQIFDFRKKENKNCDEPVSGRFFYQLDCFQYPIRYDRDRRDVFQKHIYPLLADRNRWGRVAALVRRANEEEVRPTTLVINMRSGRDIFRVEPPPQSDYMQPPLSFYKHVIESHGFEDCLIVTEADRRNPCIEALMRWNRTIRIRTHTDVLGDARTLLSATNLVSCHSTFSWCLALMSRNLRTLYQPGSCQIRGINDVDIHTYEFAQYILPGEWTASADQLQLMLSHSMNDIHVTHRPIGSDENGEPELSTLW